MMQVKTAALALALMAFGGQAFAADAMMAKPMTAKETKMMKSCMAMSEPMRMKDKGCVAMMKAHPDAGKSTGAMSSGAMSSGGMK